MGYKIGMPCMKLNNAGNKSKHSGSFGRVSMEALEERKGRDPDINPSLSYLNQAFGIAEDVRSRFNDSIEREIRCGMIEEPEYGIESPRCGLHR